MVTANGARVVIVQPDAKDACTAAESIDCESQGFGAAVSDPVQERRMVEQVAATFGRVDGLVNNASLTGMPLCDRFRMLEQIERIVDVNVKGAIWCSQAVTRHMIANLCRGGIMRWHNVDRRRWHFRRTGIRVGVLRDQSGLGIFAQSMALDFATRGVSVNAIARATSIPVLARRLQRSCGIWALPANTGAEFHSAGEVHPPRLAKQQHFC